MLLADKRLIEASVRSFFTFLKANDCQLLASNKDGLSELSHRLKLWNTARYATNCPGRNKINLKDPTLLQNELSALKAMGESKKLQNYNKIRL